MNYYTFKNDKNGVFGKIGFSTPTTIDKTYFLLLVSNIKELFFYGKIRHSNSIRVFLKKSYN